MKFLLKKNRWALFVLSPFFLFLNISISFASDELQNQKSIARYLELYEKYPHAFGPKGNWKKGEMELVCDIPTMTKVQRRFSQPVGIVSEDRFWMWVRDVIILPSGEYNTYNRFLPKKGLEGPAGVVVLAVTSQGDILVNLIYRHATRSWEMELPRGGRNTGETAQAAGRREVREETGYSIKEMQPLGTIAADSGICSNFLQVLFAKIDKLEKIERDEEEIIAFVTILPKNKVEDVFCEGKMEFIVNGEKITAYCRDSFFAYALFLAEKKKLL